MRFLLILYLFFVFQTFARQTQHNQKINVNQDQDFLDKNINYIKNQIDVINKDISELEFDDALSTIKMIELYGANLKQILKYKKFESKDSQLKFKYDNLKQNLVQITQSIIKDKPISRFNQLKKNLETLIQLQDNIKLHQNEHQQLQQLSEIDLRFSQYIEFIDKSIEQFYEIIQEKAQYPIRENEYVISKKYQYFPEKINGKLVLYQTDQFSHPHNKLLNDKNEPVIAIAPNLWVKSKSSSKVGRKWIPNHSTYEVIDALTAAGANVLVVKYHQDVVQVLKKIDGWIIPGGKDMNPKHYAQFLKKETHVNPKDRNRFQFDTDMYFAAPDEMPIVGICYGSQFINVINGGNLHQNFGTCSEHKKNIQSKIEIFSETKLNSILNTPYIVGTCNHHQSINKLASGFRVNAQTSDGVIHGLESMNDKRFILGVQWHPERQFQDSYYHKLLIHEFVNKAKQYKQYRLGP